MTDISREAIADHLREFSMTTLTEDLILALRAALDDADARERQAVMTHRHVKRGTEYRIVARAKVQTDMPLGDYDEVIVYADAEGKTWVRPVTEFEDGRFVAIRTGAKL